MAVLVANTLINNTFDFWRSRTNQMADIISKQAVTCGGIPAVGAAEVTGTFRANTHYVDFLRGGTANTANTLVCITPFHVENSQTIAGSLAVTQNASSNNFTANTVTGNLRVQVGTTQVNPANVISTAYYGTWQGNTIAINKGGTGITVAPSNGAILVGSGSSWVIAGIAGSQYLGVTTGAGSITLSNLGVTRFQANSAGTWRTGDITLNSADVVNALGFVPAVANTDSWYRIGGDLNYVAGNVAIGFADSNARSTAKLMILNTTSTTNYSIYVDNNVNTATGHNYIGIGSANTSSLTGINFLRGGTLKGAVEFTGSNVLRLKSGASFVAMDASGNFGINTETPQPNNGGRGIQINDVNAGITLDQGNGVKWHIGTNPNPSMVNGTRLGGHFGIYSDNAKAGLIVTGNTVAAQVHMYSGGAARIAVDPTGIVRINTAATDGMLNVGGDITTSGGFTNYSDYRLKEEVEPIVDALERIEALNPVAFRYIKERRREEGFLAHEVQSVVPTAVKGVKDGVVYQTLDKSQVLPVTVKALQDLINIVKKQQQEIDELRNR